MNIILNFSDDTKTSNTITELIRLNDDELNIDSVIKTIYGKLNEIVAKTLDLIDRNIYLQIIKNQNVQLISSRYKTIKTAYVQRLIYLCRFWTI